jgi:hypothetical protein
MGLLLCNLVIELDLYSVFKTLFVYVPFIYTLSVFNFYNLGIVSFKLIILL